MKFTSAFYGCRDGEIYPVRFEPGDECPKELEAAARAAGSLAGKAGNKAAGKAAAKAGG